MVSTLSPGEISEYESQPEIIQKLIRDSLALTTRNLTYLYGSNSPKRGGMDCSGTVQYLLKNQNLRNTPRQADQIHDWSIRSGTFREVTAKSLDSNEYDDLRPGDLLFWSGTYGINRAITHVMIYLGTHRETGKPVMVGASDGRSYNGKKRRGVSVFDFRLPRADSKAKFVGYASIPGLTDKPNEKKRSERDEPNDGTALVF
ncbi:MAG: NlpC/P60 family protein [Sedimenticolaceae bacterium]|nr:NlpC/P60 family protein [Sedimenticolaceae bacterium]